MSEDTCTTCGSSFGPGATRCPKCGAARIDATANPWQRLLERLEKVAAPRYRVTRLLGYGGMAGVYLADEPRLGRKVAIKVMSPALMMDPGLVARFSQEARITAQLAHPNIATIYDVDEREGLHYFVMEYVSGRSIGQVMAATRGERLPTGIVLHWLAQAASALSYAHRAGVVHRDIKPGNILLTSEGNVRVTDFGIAKVADEPSLTRTGFLVGTPAYMSPEQCGSGVVGGASDQYALGVVAYELLAGRPPFTGATMAVVQAHLNQDPPSLLDLRPDCPVEVADGIRRMLAKRPEDRFPSPAAAVAEMGARPLPDEHPLRAQAAALATGGEAGGRPPRPPFTLSVPRANLTAGQELDLRGALAGEALATPITWSTSDPRIATVDGDGNLITHRPGLVTVTAATGQYRATALLTVLAPDTEDLPPFLAPESAPRHETPAPAPGPPQPLEPAPTPPPREQRETAYTRVDPRTTAAAPRPAAAGQSERRAPIWVAAGLVLALGSGFFVLRAVRSGGESTLAGSGALPLPPTAPPPAAQESGTDTSVDADTTGGDPQPPAPPPPPPPATTPTPPPAPAEGTLRIAASLPSSATVTIRGAGQNRRWTGGDVALPPGTYALQATAEGYETASGSVRVEAGRTATWSPTLARIPVSQPQQQPQTPPPPLPPPAATPPAAPDPAVAEQQVRTVIGEFVTALQARDLDAIVRRFPGTAGEWASAWRPFYSDRRNVQDLSTRLGSVTGLTVDGATARASFTVAAQFDGTGGRQRPTFVFDATFTHDGSAWVMTALRQTR